MSRLSILSSATQGLAFLWLVLGFAVHFNFAQQPGATAPAAQGQQGNEADPVAVPPVVGPGAGGPGAGMMGPGAGMGMSGAMGGGYGGMGGYGMGGYGGGMGMGGYGGISLRFMILEGKNNAGNEHMKVRTASRVKSYAYRLASLKPHQSAAYGGMGGDMGAMGGMGAGMMDGGYGGGAYGGEGGLAEGYGSGGGMGGYGGEGGMAYGYGAAGGNGGAPGMSGTPTTLKPIIPIYAFIFDKEQEDNRTKIELLTNPPTQSQKSISAGGPAAGDAGGFGAEGQPGANPFGAASGGETDMGGGGGMPGGMGQVPRYVRLSSLVGEPTGPNDKNRLTQAEYEIVSKTILQQIWLADAEKKLNAAKGNLAGMEDYLKQLLTEEYETQLARQSIEVETIERRIAELKDEIARRRAAKDRVIDVQLGRIVLEAQGLLGK